MNRIQRTIWKKTAVLLMSAVILLPYVSEVDAEETGSLTLQCHIKDEEGAHYFAGDTYAILPVADLVLDEGNATYVMREDFVSFDCDWNELSASQLKDMAEEMAEVADFSNAMRVDTDDEGVAYFESLAPALYLIDRVETTEENEVYSVDPMLISVPSFSDNAWEYNVVTTPKFSEVTPVPEETETPDEELPATGQLKWPVPLLAIGGVVFIGVGLFLSNLVEKK